MRSLLVGMIACLPLLQAQDTLPLKTVEPQYDEYSPDLEADFDVTNASVTMTVMASGKPLSLDSSSVPLPIAVVMALKDYEYRPKAEAPHGQGETEIGTYPVTLSVPVRQSKNPVREGPSVVRVGPGIGKGLLVTRGRIEYPEFARHNRVEGTIVLNALINQQGEPESLKTSAGSFLLIEAAYNAVTQWRWRPYLLNRVPVQMLMDVEVVFKLN